MNSEDVRSRRPSVRFVGRFLFWISGVVVGVVLSVLASPAIELVPQLHFVQRAWIEWFGKFPGVGFAGDWRELAAADLSDNGRKLSPNAIQGFLSGASDSLRFFQFRLPTENDKQDLERALSRSAPCSVLTLDRKGAGNVTVWFFDGERFGRQGTFDVTDSIEQGTRVFFRKVKATPQ